MQVASGERGAQLLIRRGGHAREEEEEAPKETYRGNNSAPVPCGPPPTDEEILRAECAAPLLTPPACAAPSLLPCSPSSCLRGCFDVPLCVSEQVATRACTIDYALPWWHVSRWRTCLHDVMCRDTRACSAVWPWTAGTCTDAASFADGWACVGCRHVAYTMLAPRGVSLETIGSGGVRAEATPCPGTARMIFRLRDGSAMPPTT